MKKYEEDAAIHHVSLFFFSHSPPFGPQDLSLRKRRISVETTEPMGKTMVVFCPPPGKLIYSCDNKRLLSRLNIDTLGPAGSDANKSGSQSAGSGIIYQQKAKLFPDVD